MLPQTQSEDRMTEHEDHPVEPHTHTVTFTDNDGQSYSFDHECPGDMVDVRDGFERTGADSVNGLCVDGKPQSFEATIRILGLLDLMPLLGESYRTDENLLKLLVGMGTMIEGD
jgi:hypothetical protein